MPQLPLNLQGYLRVIQIPLEAGRLPVAFISYLRPQKIEDGYNIDIIDEKILEAIQTKFPAATRSNHHAIDVEQLRTATIMFHDWYNYAILVALIPTLDSVIESGFDIPTIPLSVYTSIPMERFSRNIIEKPDDPELDNWIRQLVPYHQLMDRLYPIEMDNYALAHNNTLPRVVDIKNLW